MKIMVNGKIKRVRLALSGGGFRGAADLHAGTAGLGVLVPLP